MSTTVRAQLEEEDYIAAQRLYRRRSPWWPAVGAIAAGLLVFIAVQSAKANNQFGLYISIAALIGGVIGAILGHYVWMPWHARRVFRQQKSLQRPYQLSWDDNGVYARDGHGEYRHLWSDFVRWREDERLFVLNLSEVMFLMVPKRGFPDPESLNRFREQVRSHVAS